MDPREQRAAIAGFILYLATIFIISWTSNTDIWLVFFGTLSILLHLILFFFLLKPSQLRVWAFWLLPVFFPVLFFLYWSTGIDPFITQMDGPTLAVVSLLIIYVINIIILLFLGDARPKVIKVQEQKPAVNDVQAAHYKHEIEKLRNQLNQQQQYAQHYSAQSQQYEQQINNLSSHLQHTRQELDISKSTISVTLRSIEDKCKAINFVIGRVYSNKRGGNAKIRGKLRINRELYNAFSAITSDFNHSDAIELMGIIERILQQLRILDLKETGVLPSLWGKTLSRETEPDFSVTDVLASNDKDPVRDYITETRDICTKMYQYLEKQ